MSARSGPGTMTPVSAGVAPGPASMPRAPISGAPFFPVPLVRPIRLVALFPFAPDT